MYISTYTALQSALSGIDAAQEELTTTGNNIANASTPGYTEESVNLAPNLPLTLAADNGAGVQVGTGVDAVSITSARNQYLDAAYRNQQAASGYATTQQSYLTQVDSDLGEPSSGGISSQLSAFWSSWNTLANDPSDLSAQQAVVSDGQNLATSINQLDQTLTTVQTQAASQFNDLTSSSGEVMTDASQIATLNASIQQAQAAGEDPNQLLDQRGNLIDNLSSLANISVSSGSDSGDSSMVNVTLGGVSLVTAQDAGSTSSAVNDDWSSQLIASNSTPTDVGGTIGSLLNVAGTAISGAPAGQIDGYLSQLDGFAGQLASEVNTPTVDAGTPSAYTATLDPPFFTGTTAATIAVGVTAGQVQTTDNTGTGDNDIATAIAGLSGGAADQAYGAFVSQIGSDTQSANTQASTQQALSTAITDQRSSVEGVDLNDEETNVVQEQAAYQACAQVMTTFSTMIQSLIAAVG